jgi:hypothetical protein
MTKTRKQHDEYAMISRKLKKPTISSYPPELRGLSQNRFGGHQTQRLRTYGGSFGPASPVRRLSSKERQAVEQDLIRRGLLIPALPSNQ